MKMKDIIQIKNLNFSYKKREVFSSFNLSVEEDTFISIAGRNGSGKTTLLKLIAGLLPSDNKIIFGHSYIDEKRLENHILDMGVVLSNTETVFLCDTVYQELAFPLENLKFAPSMIESRIKEICAFFEVQSLLDKKIIELTNAEKEKLKILLALIHQPKLLLLDNPVSMLSKEDAKFFLEHLKMWKEEYNTTIILFTTSLEDTLFSDYLYVLEEGHMKIEGKPVVVMQEEKLLRQLGLELPFMMDLSLKFQFYELLDENILEMDRMVNKLWK